MFIQELAPKVAGSKVGSLATDAEIVKFGISAYASINFRLNMVCSAVSGTATAKVQVRVPGGDYEDLGSANASLVLADGTNVIRLNIQTPADLVDMPLAKDCRLVITTAAASGVTLDKLSIQQG
jgi:hypothetical protein